MAQRVGSKQALEAAVTAIAQTDQGRESLDKYKVKTKVQYDKDTGAQIWVIVSARDADDTNELVNFNW